MSQAASVGARAARAFIGVSLSCAALAASACERAQVALPEVPAPAAASSDARAASAPPTHAIADGEGELPMSTKDSIAEARAELLTVHTASVTNPPPPPPPPKNDASRAATTPTGALANAAGEHQASLQAPADASYERFAGSTFRVEQIVRTLSTSSFSDLRPVGSTSVVLRANLDAPFRAALKLATHERPLGAAAEVAAYRLSRCLGLTTVPPAVLRRLPVSSVQQAFEPHALERWPEVLGRVALDSRAQVEAAAIFWVEGMRELPIATREARQPALQALLQGNPIATDQQLMAAQLSDLSAFDLLLGNGDRWSGGNVQGDATGQWLYLRDHDLAFATQLRSQVEEPLLAQLSQVERFSRGLIEHVRALTPERVEREWSMDEQLARADRAAWLRERVMPGIMGRRAKLLSHVQHLVFRYGEDAVLVFP